MFDIVMPLFNKETFVSRTIESVLAQTFPHWRLIIVDDGSSDSSVVVAERYEDPRISLLRQPNSGPGVARNTGIAAGTSEWISFLDADDLWLPNHLETLDRLRLRFPNATLIGSAFVPWNGEEVVQPVLAAPASEELIRYFYEAADARAPFFTSSAAANRRAVQKVGPLKPVVIGDEMDLWARLALHGPVAASRRATVLYRVGTGGITDSNVGTFPCDASSLSLGQVTLPIATLLERLPSIEDPVLRKDIASYIDYEAGLFLTHALRNGRVDYARQLSRLFLEGPRGRTRVSALLAHLPRPLGQRLLVIAFLLMRTLRRLRSYRA